jgi:hypothetical protein
VGSLSVDDVAYYTLQLHVYESSDIVHAMGGLIEANKSRSKIQLEINGDPEEVIKFIKTIDETLRRAENLVEWGL